MGNRRLKGGGGSREMTAFGQWGLNSWWWVATDLELTLLMGFPFSLKT